MNNAQPVPPQPGNEPNFERPLRDVISEANWPEFQAKGFVFLENQADTRDETVASRVDEAVRFFGRTNVYTGDAYDWHEQRPLANMPGLGIYIGPEGDVELAHVFSKSWIDRQDQSSSSAGGPASS